jgi:small subunit ribosomal protein S2
MEKDNPKASEAQNPLKARTSDGEDYFAGFNFEKAEVNIEEMMKSGVHFGHQKSRKNPRMEKYIFTHRKGISIIDLEKTEEKIKEAVEFIGKVRKEGKSIVFVGTKRQIKNLIRSFAAHFSLPFVVERWLGGTFTNFKIIRSRTKYLKEMEEKMEKGEFKKYTKFEQAKKMEEMEKLEKKMGGIKNMNELPGAVFISDLKEEELAMKEAKKIGIPVIAVADTNTDPTLVDYPIPANDDAVSSVRLILGYLGKALAGK